MQNYLIHYGTVVPINSTSEDLHRIEVSHFTSKRNPARYAKKTGEEHAELAKRTRKFPNGNGTPSGFNL